MSKSNEPTADGPTAPTDRMAAARAAKAAKAEENDRIAQLEEQVRQLVEMTQKVRVAADMVAEPPASKPGEYFMAGTDAATGKPVYRKRKWTRSDVEREYQKVTFAPTLTVPVRPHGVTYDLEAGKIATVPSIVKDIHDQMVFAIRRQSEGYRVSEEQSKRVFDAAKGDPMKGRHFTGLEHIGYGWPIEALQAAGKGLGDDPKTIESIGWEPEIGFPGGYNGKPLPDNK